MAHVEVLATSRDHPAKALAERRARASGVLGRRIGNAFILALGDVLALAASLLTASILDYGWSGQFTFPIRNGYILLAWLGGAFTRGLLPSWGLGPVIELRRLILLLTVVFGGVALVEWLISGQQTPLIGIGLGAAFALSAITVPLMRTHTKRLLVNLGGWGMPSVVYGAGEMGASIIRLLREERGLGYNLIGAFDDDQALWGKQQEGVRVLGGMNLATGAAPAAIVALSDVGRERFGDLLEGSLSHYRTVLVIPDLGEVPSLWVRPCDIEGTLGLEIPFNLASPSSRFAKRALDLLVVLVTAPFWLTACGLLALLVWFEDRQDPFFFQERVGKGGRSFKTWKFRTMVVNAEEVLQQELAEDPALHAEWRANYKLRRDPRITRVGPVLRSLSLDELPQLINVLRGEMSLVGPRPLPWYHHAELPYRVQRLRERVRPGITGLWQVSGRSEAGTEGMERWDPYYVRNWSPWLDVVVLVRTVRAVLQRSGAY